MNSIIATSKEDRLCKTARTTCVKNCNSQQLHFVSRHGMEIYAVADNLTINSGLSGRLPYGTRYLGFSYSLELSYSLLHNLRVLNRARRELSAVIFILSLCAPY